MKQKLIDSLNKTQMRVVISKLSPEVDASKKNRNWCKQLLETQYGYTDIVESLKEKT